MTNWPRFESHKIVQALPIVAIIQQSSYGPVLWVQPDPGAPHEVFEPTEPGMAKRAEVGGYAVIYADGFKSVSPKKAFEDGYAALPSCSEATRHIVECWVDGVPVPLTLAFRDAEAAEVMRQRISVAAGRVSHAADVEAARAALDETVGEEGCFRDDFGQSIAFSLTELLAIRAFEA